MAKRTRGQARKPKTKKGRGGKAPLRIAVFQLVSYAICVGACAILTLHSDGSMSADFYRIVGALSIAAFCSAYFAARQQKQNGLLTGFLSTLPLHVLLLVLSLVLGSFRFDWTLLFSLLILSLVSMLGGVLAVNRRETPRVPAVKR